MNKQTIFINGEIITVNMNNDICQALAIRGNQIIATGSNEKVLELQDSKTEIVNLHGQTLLPGFIDSHLHITMYGINRLSIHCKQDQLHSISSLLEALKIKVAKTPKGEWVRAFGYNENHMTDKRLPTKQELDTVSKDHPIIVGRVCGHASVVNSKAFQLTGINKHTPDPMGGKYEKNEAGELNGTLIENAHMNMFAKAAFSESELSEAHKIASQEFAAKGITSIHDATGYGLDNLRKLQQDARSGTIQQRVYAMVGALNNAQDVVKHMVLSGVSTGVGDTKFRVGPVKLFLDGSSSGPTVWTRDPYTSDHNNYGIHYFSQEEVDELFIPAHEKGWQITAHAQGDAAIDMLLTTIETANRLYPRTNSRHRIEHAGVAAPDLVKRMKEQHVVPTPNPAFHFEYGDGYVKDYGERSSYMYPLNDYLKAGIPAAIASDCPVTDVDPFRGLYGAITRMSESGQIIGEDQRIPLLEAIRMYTYNGAYASFEEKIKGSIEPGKLADLVLMNCSLLNSHVNDLLEAKVEWTMIDGKIVYQNKGEAIYVPES
ncbi:amidohydrolase [Virgibacillus pantothenticus]|uniref:amidohydrolase n=2 Tax=Virgibacillus pantothenticus TaxID=1473 RepID=UPI001B08C70E|nr:amidohydrolase [Virgibacillus pantothenticus]